MTNEANDIFKQARQGSVAAIIQVLNEKLAGSGVRTRAIFSDGILQLLCEGETVEQLEQAPLTEKIRQILEAIAPRNIRRVNINSRIVREQQLLWLEEISRDPENQLLWSQEIVLKKPGFFKQLASDWSDRSSEPSRSDLTKASVGKSSTFKQREQRQFWRGLAGGALVSGLLLAAGWYAYNRLNGQPTVDLEASFTPGKDQSPAVTGSSTPPAPPQAALPPVTQPASDPFVNAVRLAEQTSQASQTASSSAEWLSLASQWQKASDWMAEVPAADKRYQTAQNRVVAYQRNREIALQRAQQVQSAGPTTNSQ
jgi:hypothetical protein